MRTHLLWCHIPRQINTRIYDWNLQLKLSVISIGSNAQKQGNITIFLLENKKYKTHDCEFHVPELKVSFWSQLMLLSRECRNARYSRNWILHLLNSEFSFPQEWYAYIYDQKALSTQLFDQYLEGIAKR